MTAKPERTILDLGPAFYDEVEPARFPQHAIRFRNDRAAETVGLGGLTDDQWINHFGRFQPVPGSLGKPLALRYHGHQFRSYNPDIGDGRGFLFAQLRDLDDNRLMDLGTKGSGQTPYSRFGDGRLTLKGGVREVLATEMLEARGVYTSRSLSLIETGESLHRGDEPSPTRSAVLVRLSHSHIRYGTFQRLAWVKDDQAMERLVDYVLKHLLPGGEGGDAGEGPAVQMLDRCVTTAARLAASYMAAGFVHGVLNTDNINVTGESFDYGPWRFAATYDLGFTAAYFDQTGLYAFGRQPEALHWNLYQLGGALLLIAEQQRIEAVLRTFPDRFEAELVAAVFRRLGIRPAAREKNLALLKAMEEGLIATRVPLEEFYFVCFGRDLARVTAHYGQTEFSSFRALLPDFAPAATRTPGYFQGDKPEDMLIDEVEAIWSHIAERDDWQPFLDKVKRIREAGLAYRTAEGER